MDLMDSLRLFLPRCRGLAQKQQETQRKTQMWTDHRVENVAWKGRKEEGSGVSLDQLDPIQSGRPCWNMAPVSGVPGTPRVSPGWTGQSSEAGPEEGVGLGDL